MKKSFSKNNELNNDNNNNHSEFEGNLGNLRYRHRFHIIKDRKSIGKQYLSSKIILKNPKNIEAPTQIKTKSKFYKNDFPNKPEVSKKYNSSTRNIVIRYNDLLIHPIKKRSDNLIIKDINKEELLMMNTKMNSSTKMICLKVEEENENEIKQIDKNSKKEKSKYVKNKRKINMNYIPTQIESNENLKKKK
jgi:hypothetical protein